MACGLCVEQQTPPVFTATMDWAIKPSLKDFAMPKKAWSAKRERQYAHIKDSLLDSGKPESVAQEIAARVVNKERAQHGELVTASAAPVKAHGDGR